jgi:hypothetical protein
VCCDYINIHDSKLSTVSTEVTKSGDGMKLPSLLESEDSELEDLLEDIWVRGRYLLNRKGSSSQRSVSGCLATRYNRSTLCT